ncbi:MAG: phosphate ABC transporter substrate-binding protein [Desulfamplus sp.]|nr:phosphate ABC transporter substrate-binding protein [Desulfamplus sp.]
MKISVNFTFLLFYLVICLIPSLIFASSTGKIKEIAVVVNPANPVTELTTKEVSDIYLSRRRTFPSGQPVLVLEQDWSGELRDNFYKRLNGMTIKRINAYWVRLKFSGEIQPPPVLPSSVAVRDTVKNNPNSIGYIEADVVDDSVRVVLILKE